MSFFVFVGCVYLGVVSGARPGRDWSSVSDRQSLEPSYEIQQFWEAAQNLETDCLELKGELEQLAIHGEGNPCSWKGIECSSNCQISKITRNDAHGDLIVVAKFSTLQTLELTNSQVAGDLRYFEKMKNLTTLRVSDTLVTGDLQSLQSLTKLEAVDLGGTKVFGGLRRLKGLKRLQMLNLGSTAVTGNLAHLRTLTKLQILDLRNVHLHSTKQGHGIEALADLRTLQQLDLSNTPVGGDLGSLGPLHDLKMLELSKTNIRGSLKQLQDLTQLEVLGLEDTQVKGTLLNIRRLTHLRHLALQNTAVNGQLGTVQRFTRLQILRLDRTSVHGDIAVFKKLPDLQVLWLYRTKVFGNVSDLQNLTGLQELDLGSTSVSGNLIFVRKLTALRILLLHNIKLKGDIASVQNLTGIQTLKIYSTKVGGDLKSIENLTRLQVLKAYGSRVAGNLNSVHHLEELYWLELSDTNVTGGLENVRRLTELQMLGLDNTKVYGDIGFLQNLTGLETLWLGSTTRGDIAVLKKMTRLQKLSLPGCDVVGDLGGLGHLTNLDRVRLSNTRVTGRLEAFEHLTRLEYLWLKNINVTGDLKVVSSMKALRELDLTKTRVNGDLWRLADLGSLEKLYLGKTKVTGDVNVVVWLHTLQVARLEGTAVSGTIRLSEWRGCCQELQELSLADSQVGPLQPLQFLPEFHTQKPHLLLPALNLLNVSGCPLNGSIQDFLWQFAGSHISMLLASGCGLAGMVPDIGTMRAKVDGGYVSAWSSTLKHSLQILDLSSNNLSFVEAVPAAVRMDLRRNAASITLPPGVLARAIKQRVELWLGDTQLANPEELQPLLSHELRLEESYTRVKEHFACRELDDAMLQVTPELFMPKDMCGCRAGYNGSGTDCSPCQANTYTDDMNLPICLPCPQNSTSPKAFASWEDCACEVGAIHHNDDGTLSCQCPRGEALVDVQIGSEHCEPCPDLKLICDVAGTNASSAPVQRGHARLRKGSHKVYKCLDAARCEPARCAEGYAGRLCSDCEPGYHASLGLCSRCTDVNDISVTKMVLLGACGAGALALLGGAAWRIRRKLADADLRLKCAVELLVPQLFALLQLVQLWGVLSRLAQPLDNIDSSGSNSGSAEESKGDAWASYLEAFQLTADELQGLVALQCLFHGATVRLIFAVATPLLPLALLLGCCFVELFTVGTGIQLGLKLLTILFIGGASGAAQLLDCQRADGTGKVSLEGFAFRRLMPHLLCAEAKWVDLVGDACAVCYGVVIPSFLAFLFAKQHLVMRQTKTFAIHCKGGPQSASLQLQMFSEAEGLEEYAKRKRLVAAAAAFVALHVQGHAVITLTKDGEVMIEDQTQTTERASVDLATDLSVDLLVKQPQEAAVLRGRGEIMRRNAMVQMLTERSILGDIQLDRSDRIMLGAKQLLCKYGSCQFVWMEVCVKVAAAALVSVVGSKDGLWLSVAITLGMALVVSITQPFVRPQENTLHTCCFACLALAAVGFHQLHTWLTRLALLVPVLLLVVSLARPDSQEALAMRLHEELEAKIRDGPVEVSAQRLQFI